MNRIWHRCIVAAILTLVGHAAFETRIEPTVAQVARPGQTFVVTTTTDGNGAGTLRTAITSANSNPGADTITFNIPGSGTQTMPITSNLPVITDPVTIDGTTQPGYSGTPLIRFTPGVGGLTSLINITGGNSTIKALSFASFSGITTNNGMIVLASNNNVVAACHSGTGSGNTQVYITGANNLVGGTTTTDRNYFYGNTSGRENVIIRGIAATGNRVTGNVFGTTPAGARQTNSGKHILIEDAPGNFVGGTVGTTPGGSCTGECNVLSGSDNDAIAIFGTGSTGNTVAGNYIGLMADGLNVNRNANYGVHIQNASNNTIGGNTSASRNVVSANFFGQIWVESGTGNVITANYIGLKANGSEAVTGTFNVPAFGVQLNSNNNRVGGDTVGERNVISGSNRGVIINGNENRVRGNYIGTDATGSTALTTQLDGVLINGANNWIGGSNGTTPAGPCTGACNVISGNGQNTLNHGLVINGSGATGNKVTGNMIGLNAAGTAAVRNGTIGTPSTNSPDGPGTGKAILVNNTSNNSIGAQEVRLPGQTNVGPEFTHCFRKGGKIMRFNETNGHYLYVDCNDPLATYTDPPLGTLSVGNTGYVFRISGRGTILYRPTDGGGSVNIGHVPPRNERVKLFDPTPQSNGNCSCVPITDDDPRYVPPQTIVGGVEIGGPNGSVNNMVAGNRLGKSSDGSIPLFANPDKILVNGTANLIVDNDIATESLAIDSLNPDNAVISNYFDGYAINFTPLQTPDVTRANVSVTRTLDGHYEITIIIDEGLPDTHYRFDVSGITASPELANAIDGLFHGEITTNATGSASVTIGAAGEIQSSTVLGSGELTATVTEIVSMQLPLGNDVTYGRTSRFAAPVHVPGTPISGRVTTPAGQGLRNAVVTLIDNQSGARLVASTSTFGYFSFADVLALRSYTLSVSSRRFRFTPQQMFVLDTMDEVTLVGQE